MEDTNDQAVEVEAEEVETPEAEITDWEAEAKKARGIAARLRTKLTKATEVKKPTETKAETKPGELDNADWALLTAKGIENDDEVEFIQTYMKKWDKGLRDVLRDADIQEKLKGMRLERDVKNAMPSATKRNSQGEINNLDYWAAKYEQTGELPDNFELRSAVINNKVQKHNSNRPSWH